MIEPDQEASTHDHVHGEHDHVHGEHDHGHVHGEHDHGHGHGEHGHVHVHAANTPEEAHAPMGGGQVLRPQGAALNKGCGGGKIVYFDAFSGMAGDMTIAAMLNLGVPLGVIEDALSCVPLEGYSLEVGQARRSGIQATTFDVRVNPGQPERTHHDIDSILQASRLDDGVRELARRIFRRLGEAEAEVHGIPLERVHFHEVGAVDAIVDIVGAAAAVRWLDASVVVSPLPMGHGFVRARHGVLPLPAPATVACLKGIPTYGADVEAELVTPTGAAIAATVADRFERWPSVVPERIGWGAGTLDIPGRPNLLRVVLGSRPASAHSNDGSSSSSATHVIVESNVDDMTGELAAHALQVLLRAGALDAWVEPIVMKKGRPGMKIVALGRTAQAEQLGTVMLTETSSIGVRFQPVNRYERPRTTLTTNTAFGPISVKVSGGPFGPVQIKPEFDECVRAAEAAKVPVREVVAATLVAARSTLVVE